MSILSKIQSLIAAANAKTGESDTTLTDAVQTLVDGYGQGGGVSFDWAQYQEIVTIGANTISSTQGVRAFFANYSYDLIYLLSELTVNNQIVCIPLQEQNNIVYRWRDNVIGSAAVSSGYDGFLVEGTKYLVLKK